MTITSQFKAALKPQTYTLESGVEVKLKRVGLMDLIQAGEIPDNLSGAAADIASRSTVRKMSSDELKRYGKLVDAVVEAALVEPAIGRDVEISDIPFAWKVKIFNWANSSPGVLRLSKFRAEQTGTVAAAQSE